MTALGQVNRYLRSLERRLRFFAASRGAAVTAACAVLLTLAFAYIGNRFEFTSNVVLPLRILLYALVAVAVTLALVLPLLRLNRRRLTRTIEQEAPEFRERLLTLTERGHESGPWMELLAEETMGIARNHTPEQMRSPRALWGLAVGALAGAALLIWLVAAGPGYWGYGASLLWTGQADVNKRPLYSIDVRPGNHTIRRHSDLAVTAQLLGFSAPDVILHARYGRASKWDAAHMEPGKGSGNYRFVFAAVGEPVEYYVEAAHSESRHFTISVRDLPGVKRIRVALHYPSELALQDVVLDPAGDIRAVNGTDAEVRIETDRPLDRGVLVLENGRQIPLHAAGGNWLSAHLAIEKDGSYHVAAIDSGETIRISEDYFVEARKDEAPVVKISRPGSDAHVSPIEEMPVTITASDDYGIGALELRYAVNGGPEQSLPLLKAKNVKEAEGKTTIAFEDLKAAPGDMVSLYAVARDAHSTSRSEIVFAQADAFDYKFSQSQQMGGGGGGAGNEAADITQRQKQLVAATFNQLKSTKTGTALAEDAKFLAGEQSKLSAQAQSMAERMASRQLGAAGSQFEEFAKLMTQASGEMVSAADQLRPAKWNSALPPEQKALTSLLRAETLFRDIQISMSRQNGGGGGGNSAGRELARMLDLELDTSKNQYETGQSAAPQSAERQKALDQAQQRLEALARRQQELAAQNLKQQSAFEQRWQEEQLRREAEELRRQLQEMARNSQNGQQSQQQQGQQGQQSQDGQQQGQQGQQSQQAQAGQQQGQPGQQGQQSPQGQGRQQGRQMAQSGQPSSQQSGQQAGQQSAGTQQGGGNRQYSGRQYGGPQSDYQQASAAQTAEAIRQATRAIERAEDEMRKSVSNHDATAGARAGEQLQQAQQLMAQALQKQAGGTVTDLASRADQIAGAQRQLAERMKQLYGVNSADLARERDRLSNYARAPGEQPSSDPNAMPEMNDPTNRRRRYGYGYSGLYPLPPSRPPTSEEKAIADEKDKLAGQIESLQRQMHQQAQGISGARPDASSKLMRALSDAESKELALRLQKNAEWLRMGYGDRNLGMEDNVTVGLQQLSGALREIQLSLNAPDPTGEGRQTARDQAAGTRTPGREESPDGYRDAVAGYFKKLSQNSTSPNR